MPVHFWELCRLLTDLEQIATHDPPYLPARKYDLFQKRVDQWFSRHQISIHSSVEDLVSILSCIFPAKRSDRAYGIQHQRLVEILKRCFGLGLDRAKLLEQWQNPGRGDLGECVERVLKQTEDLPTLARQKVTIKDVDAALVAVASRSRLSSSKVRAVENDAQFLHSLENLFRKLHPEEGKWLTRIILKDSVYGDLTPEIVYAAIHPRLVHAVVIYDDIEAAITESKKLLNSTQEGLRDHGGSNVCQNFPFQPRIGVKVGAPNWVKAKGGLKHAISLCKKEKVSVEKKYDGEYCQVHIDLSKGQDCVQIFSKSGKDSTIDRIAVHEPIKQSLGISDKKHDFRSYCILEGELLVWDEQKQAVAEFHKIRKHVSRSGTFLGTEKDSQPHPWEHLMIMFFDVLLIDHKAVLFRPYEERRSHLKRLVKRIPGKADFVWRANVDMSQPNGPERLRSVLANALARRWEGLVIKPCKDAYFNSDKRPLPWIKLKKDCIKGYGDTADFAVIGAGYDAKTAAKWRISYLRWTHFFIACLKDQPVDEEYCQRREVLVIDCVSECISMEDIKALNQHGNLRAMQPSSLEAAEMLEVEFRGSNTGSPGLSAIFREPFVFEIAGSGFDKSSGKDFFALRFPRVMKIHWDRDWRNATSFLKLQEMASEARQKPGRGLKEEIANWEKSLQQLDHAAKDAWISTDDEMKDQDRNTPSSKFGARGRRSPRNCTSPVMVRIDSTELEANEKFESGKEIAQTSKAEAIQVHSKANNLPASIASKITHESGFTVRSLKRKQQPAFQTLFDAGAQTLDHSTEIKERAKKSRRTAISSSPSIRSVTSVRSPLQELTNLSSSPAHRSPPRTWASTTLLHKILVGSHQETHQRYRNSRRIVKMSSSPKQTETNSTAISEHVVQPSSSPSKSTSQVNNINPEDLSPIPPRPSIPNLRECQVYLSYRVFDRPDKLQALLSDLLFPPIEFPRRPAAWYVDNPVSVSNRLIDQGTKTMLLLYDSNVEQDLHSVPYKMAHNMAGLQRKQLVAEGTVTRVFDWRILDLVARYEKDGDLAVAASGHKVLDLVDEYWLGDVRVYPPGPRPEGKRVKEWVIEMQMAGGKYELWDIEGV